MYKWITVFIATLFFTSWADAQTLVAKSNPYVLGAGTVAAAAGTWYYSQSTATNTAALDNTEVSGETVVATAGGTAKKLSVKIGSSGNCDFKIMLYNSTGTLLASEVASSTSADDDTDKVVDLDPTVSGITNGQTLLVVVHEAVSSCFNVYYNGVSGGHYETGIAYATDPRASITPNTGLLETRVGVYIE